MASEGERRRAGFAIFGIGRAGQIHLGNILKMRRAHLMYVVEEDLVHGRSVLEKHLVDKEVKLLGLKDADQIFNDPGVAAVVVCTPTNTHKKVVQQALKCGKAVFCEKPIAVTLEETESCYDDAEKFGVPLFCAFNRRFDPNVCQMRERYRRGEIGQAQCFKTCSRDSPAVPLWYLKISGGIFHDCGVHDIDMVCWILGEYPVSVFSQAHAFRQDIADIGDVDQVMIVMKFASGCIATVDMSRDAVYGYDQRLELKGSKGMLEQQNRFPTTVVKYDQSGLTGGRIEESFPQRYRESYQREMSHFLDNVLGVEKEVGITKDETLRVSLIASACEESYRTGKQIFMDNYKENGGHK